MVKNWHLLLLYYLSQNASQSER